MNIRMSILGIFILGGVMPALQAGSLSENTLRGFKKLATSAERIAIFNKIKAIFANQAVSQKTDREIFDAFGVHAADLKKNLQWSNLLGMLEVDFSAWSAHQNSSNAQQLVDHVRALGNSSLFSAIFPNGPEVYQAALKFLSDKGQPQQQRVSMDQGLSGSALQSVFSKTGKELLFLQQLTTIPGLPLTQNLEFLGTDSKPAKSTIILLPIAKEYVGNLQFEVLKTADLLLGNPVLGQQITLPVGFNYSPNSISISAMLYELVTYLTNNKENQPAQASQGTVKSGNPADIRYLFSGGAIPVDVLSQLLIGHPDVTLLNIQAKGDFNSTFGQAMNTVTLMKQQLEKESILIQKLIDNLSKIALLSDPSNPAQNVGFGVDTFAGLNPRPAPEVLSMRVDDALTLLCNTLFNLTTIVTQINQKAPGTITPLNRRFANLFEASNAINSALDELGTLANIVVDGGPVARA